MKIACSPTYSPHEDVMDRKLALNESKEDPQSGFTNYYHHSAAISPGSPPLMAATSESEEAYYARQPAPDHASPSDRSWSGNPYMNIHEQHQVSQQQQQYGSPQFYLTQQQQQLQQHQQRAILYNNQLMHPPQAPHGYYQNTPSSNWHIAQPPPMMPSMPSIVPPQPYYGQHHHQHVSPHHSPHRPGPQPLMTMYQTLDSRGSLSSYGSSDTTNSSAHRHAGHGRRGRGAGRSGGGRRGSQHRNGNGNNNNGGSPPNRGWYRYDDSTTLYQMRGRIVEIAKDRDGSKFIQRRLQLSDHNEMQVAYEEAVEGIDELWNDVYGNYILQGILELGTEGMKDGIGRKIVEGDVVSLSTKVYGCRLIQKALDTLTKEDVANIVSSIKGKVWLLVHDHNGNHVIQKSVTKINEFFHQARALKQAAVVHAPLGLSQEGLEEEECDAEHAMLADSLDLIIEEVNASIKDLAIHPYGCRVVQRLIEHSVDPHKEKVLDCIVEEGLFSTLINHEYGNYVVQRVLAYGRESDKDAIFDTITSNILKLSKMKHSSNVVEMMLTYGNVEQRHDIVEEILNCYCVDQDFVSKPAAVSMAEDSYGNYVVKTSLDVLQDGPQRERLFNLLISNLEDLEKSPFAKQVVLRVKTYTQDSAYE